MKLENRPFSYSGSQHDLRIWAKSAHRSSETTIRNSGRGVQIINSGRQWPKIWGESRSHTISPPYSCTVMSNIHVAKVKVTGQGVGTRTLRSYPTRSKLTHPGTSIICSGSLTLTLIYIHRTGGQNRKEHESSFKTN